MIQKVFIDRLWTSQQGTFGILSTDDFSCRTGELPWFNNARNVSCIPEGVYDCVLIRSRKFGQVFLVKEVKNRSGILFHSGNLSGSKRDGYRTHSYGCILLGKYYGAIRDQEAVLYSKPTVRRFKNAIISKEFELNIINPLIRRR